MTYDKKHNHHDRDRVYCLLCGDETYGWEDAVEHMRVAHPEHYSEPERWPDGSLVIEDSTLEPRDFNWGPEVAL